MRLRDYQEAAANGVFEAWKDNTSALAVLPTGLGKTVLFAEIIRRMNERGARAMVLAHREELITQAADKIKRVTGLEAQIEMGEYHVQSWWGDLPPVIVSTVQTQCAGGDGAGAGSTACWNGAYACRRRQRGFREQCDNSGA